MGNCRHVTYCMHCDITFQNYIHKQNQMAVTTTTTTHMVYTVFNSHFPGKPGLTGSRFPDSQSPSILILSVITGQTKTNTNHTHVVLWVVSRPLTLTTIPRDFRSRNFHTLDGLRVTQLTMSKCQSIESSNDDDNNKDNDNDDDDEWCRGSE